MRSSNYLLATLKEDPAEADVISNKLMLRAGLIRKTSAGLYTWLPTGMRVLNKVTKIVRDEMDKSGAFEVLMTMVQPAELWKESGRWDAYGPELLRLKDRHDRDFVLGPTHEEVIGDIFKREVSSYKQLPINLYQIQTKFRDEVRPRFGVMRSREFIMKDAYSFHNTRESLQETYDVMYQTYSNIFDRVGLDYRPVRADTGSIGGAFSHEFQVLANSGEDDIVFSTDSDYAANIELAEAVDNSERQAPTQELRFEKTPNTKTIDDVVTKYNQPIKKALKTLVVKGTEKAKNGLVGLVLRGDHQLNEIKAEKLELVQSPLEFADEKDVRKVVGTGYGSLGVINLPISMIVDRSAAKVSDFSCGGNVDDTHYFGVNWDRDIAIEDVADIRNVVEGDPSPDGKGTLLIKRGIEVGHIFQLGTKYSEAMNINIQGEDGKLFPVIMGCYGIGVTRIVAATVEQNYDEKGIIWPESIAPFKVAIIPVNYYKSEQVKDKSEQLYSQLEKLGIEVLIDDRNERMGVMFADMELIGIPHLVIIGEKNLQNNQIEYKNRKTGETKLLSMEELVKILAN